jgi:hypothetical protein
VVVLLAWRMTIGVDLTDESYYVTFLDGWLKDGLGRGENLVVHQTAALLLYPAARLYTWITGGERGIVLFLRFLFLAMACAASLCQYRFIRRVRGAAVAWSSALLVLCFIPFSLPAPSYNTIGMFGMLAALALFGIAASPQNPGAYNSAPAMLSGAAWMVAVVAYPTLAAALLALLVVALAGARASGERRALLDYAMVCAVFQFCGAGLLLSVFGWARLWDMLRFSGSALQSADYLDAKVEKSLELFAAHPAFDALCLAAAALGIWRLAVGPERTRAIRPSLLVAVILVASCAAGPALWIFPHDIVVLLVLVGLFALRAEPRPAICAIYLASVVGGVMTAASSSNGIYNFPIGALAAAALAPALLVPRDASRSAVAAQCGMLLLTALLFCAGAFASIYGESANPLTTNAVRLRDGPFAGLLTDADQAAFIAAATAALDGRGRTILVLGRTAGVYLLTDASPMAPSAFDYWQFYGSLSARMEAMMAAFYRDPARRPDVVAVFIDARTYPLAPWAQDLLKDYIPADRVSVGSWSLALYLRCKPPGCPAPVTNHP